MIKSQFPSKFEVYMFKDFHALKPNKCVMFECFKGEVQKWERGRFSNEIISVTIILTGE